MSSELTLRYGCNPHQAPARIVMESGELPIEVLCGSPGYINLLDAFNSWALVRELHEQFSLPAAASFKHVSPAGAAIAVPLSDEEARACFVDDLELTPLATAYSRARGADRMSSFGDWAALSEVCDGATARVLKREVSDGVIAPGYEPEALEILRGKKGGKYSVVRIDPAFTPGMQERRQVYGVTFEQRRNDCRIDEKMLQNRVTARKDLTAENKRDLLVAQIALKYTQSNSVCFAHNGQVVGTGAGQQSRVHCVRLAGDKCDKWFLRRHPRVLEMKFKEGMKRPERDNAIDQFLEPALTRAEREIWQGNYTEVPEPLSPEEKQDWLDSVSGVALASDAFFPFRDSIDRAQRSGVSVVMEPGGAKRDDAVIAACDEYGMVMAFTGVRLFHH